MKPLSYILDENRNVIPAADLKSWARWFESADRVVAQNQIGPYWISTVFVGVDHRHFGDGPPIVFETMVFADGDPGEQYRYCTWTEAEAGHEAMAAKYRGKLQ